MTSFSAWRTVMLLPRASGRLLIAPGLQCRRPPRDANGRCRRLLPRNSAAVHIPDFLFRGAEGRSTPSYGGSPLPPALLRTPRRLRGLGLKCGASLKTVARWPVPSAPSFVTHPSSFNSMRPRSPSPSTRSTGSKPPKPNGASKSTRSATSPASTRCRPMSLAPRRDHGKGDQDSALRSPIPHLMRCSPMSRAKGSPTLLRLLATARGTLGGSAIQRRDRVSLRSVGATPFAKQGARSPYDARTQV